MLLTRGNPNQNIDELQRAIASAHVKIAEIPLSSASQYGLNSNMSRGDSSLLPRDISNTLTSLSYSTQITGSPEYAGYGAAITRLLQATPLTYSSSQYSDFKRLSAFKTAKGTSTGYSDVSSEGRLRLNDISRFSGVGVPGTGNFADDVNAVMVFIPRNVCIYNPSTSVYISANLIGIQHMLVSIAKLDANANYGKMLAYAGNLVAIRVTALVDHLLDQSIGNRYKTVNLKGEVTQSLHDYGYIGRLNDLESIIVSIRYFSVTTNDLGALVKPGTISRRVNGYRLTQSSESSNVALELFNNFAYATPGVDSENGGLAYPVDFPDIEVPECYDVVLFKPIGFEVEHNSDTKTMYNEIAYSMDAAIYEVRMYEEHGAKPIFMSDYDFIGLFSKYNHTQPYGGTTKRDEVNASSIAVAEPSFLDKVGGFFSGVFSTIKSGAEWVIDKALKVLSFAPIILPFVL